MKGKRVLIANRGEIAVRVARTCRELDIPTVAIYTELDAAAPHVVAADESCVVPTYLDIEAIVDRARQFGCWAIHPGYGFLSENPAFARAVAEAGLVFVGPSAEVMEKMGRKDAAREIAVAAGVPVVPRGEDAGYPVLVKAAAGGGGKGMRIVRAAEEYDEAVAAAKREAASAFGDDTILVEKYVEHGRHIEVQVLGDTHGNIVHLFERDCSTQRRHQKVLEEAPAPTLDEATRHRVRQSAVDLAREVGYVNAGTVEFLLDADSGEFFFLEMNTRLQVEHPVTEAVTGRDLVALQLAVAAGDSLPFAQDDLTLNGHAIEARVYAEDSFGGFLPQAGTATHVQWPPGARVDHALESGQTISTAYDPMLGKVIVHGPDRESARRTLVAALDDTAILGLTTNVGFLRALTASDEFRDATIDTAWLDTVQIPGGSVPAPDPGPARELAAWEVFLSERERNGPFGSDGFRLGLDAAPVVVELDEPVTLGPPPARRAVAAVRHDRVEVAHHGQRFVFERPDVFGDHAVATGDGSITAPMPGTVIDVRVEAGATVAEGDVLGVLEAMKMELALKAPFAGTVTEVDATKGDRVALGATLFVVEASR